MPERQSIKIDPTIRKRLKIEKLELEEYLCVAFISLMFL
jgi:hypothetical protein